MIKKVNLTILILFLFCPFISGEKKEEKASTHSFDADINIYEIQTESNKKLNEKNKVSSEFVRLYDGSPQKFYYKKINLKSSLIVVIKADMKKLLTISVYKEGKTMFELKEIKYNDNMNNNFSFGFTDKKDSYLIEARTWLYYIGDFGHGDTISGGIYKKN